MKITFYLIILTAMLMACKENEIPVQSRSDQTASQLRGTWVPVELTLRYAVGIAPQVRDTLVRLTPTTAPLLVAGRPNPIMAFTDTLVFGNQAKADTFQLRNRGLKQQGSFAVLSTDVEGMPATTIRIGRPAISTTSGAIVRYNYDVALHGIVTRNANGTPSYASTLYVNHVYGLKSISANELVIAIQAPTALSNLPLVTVTPQNQDNSLIWISRNALMTATFRKQ